MACSSCSTQLGVSNNYYLNHTDEKGVIYGLKHNLIISPGEQISYTGRMFGGDTIKIDRLADDGRTLHTVENHCLTPGTAVHIDFCDGICSEQTISSCLYIDTVPTANTFTLRNGDTPPTRYDFKRTALEDPDPTVPGAPVNGWVARAADLAGYRCRLRLVIGTQREPKLISIGAIKILTKQLQLKGNFVGLLSGDKIELSGHIFTVVASQKATYENVCFTVVQVEEEATATVNFSDKAMALHRPSERIIQTTVPALDCGWVSASISGVETQKLAKYTLEERGKAVKIGFWEFTIEWGGVPGSPASDKWPDHIGKDYDNFYSFVPIDRGVLYLI